MSLREMFRGTGVAIVTPFDKEGSIDWTSFEKVINHIIDGKCEYLVVLGTTGESATIHGKDEPFQNNLLDRHWQQQRSTLLHHQRSFAR